MKAIRLNGVPIPTMQDRLEKMIIFDLCKKLRKDVCRKCGQKITDYTLFSLDHKESWIRKSTKKERWAAILDYKNIELTHKHCNTPEYNFGTSQTGYIGVCKNEYSWKSRKTGEIQKGINYAAKVNFSSKGTYFGYYKDPYQAALARDMGAMKMYNGECRLNFEDKREFYKEKLQLNDWEWIKNEDIKSI